MDTVKTAALAIAVLAFIALGAANLIDGDWRTGLASLALALVNALVLS